MREYNYNQQRIKTLKGINLLKDIKNINFLGIQGDSNLTFYLNNSIISLGEVGIFDMELDPKTFYRLILKVNSNNQNNKINKLKINIQEGENYDLQTI